MIGDGEVLDEARNIHALLHVNVGPTPNTAVSDAFVSGL
jgi:hypothetical protein